MKYKILYNTRISTKNYKAGDEIEFASGTDELFIKRLVDIKCIEPVAGSEKQKEPKNLRGTNVKEQEKQAKKQDKKRPDDSEDDDLGVNLDDIEG
ncbi:hypothetical protein [Campylobacter concisus]|uniref:hypothetical protein n=1 Tax=Campylobacter concisus TaxID=199 RepID=UPI000CD9A552|nr:hypothetical protein [Campylobacter concisus]